MVENTRDLTKFGYRELAMAGELLTAYAGNPPDFFTDGVTIEFNPNSGEVFLVDEDYNIGVLADGTIAQWFDCPNCGKEGLAEEIDDGDGHSFDDNGNINCPFEED